MGKVHIFTHACRFALIMSLPTYQLQSRQILSKTPNFPKTACLQLRLRSNVGLFLFRGVRGGSEVDEAPTEKDTGSSDRYRDFPLQEANDNLAELLGKDTDEDEVSLDDVIWRDPHNETDSIPISRRASNYSEASTSDSAPSEAGANDPDFTNLTDIDTIKQNVGKRKSARWGKLVSGRRPGRTDN